MIISKPQAIVFKSRLDSGVAGEVLGRYDSTLFNYSRNKGMTEAVGGDLLVDISFFAGSPKNIVEGMPPIIWLAIFLGEEQRPRPHILSVLLHHVG